VCAATQLLFNVRPMNTVSSMAWSAADPGDEIVAIEERQRFRWQDQIVAVHALTIAVPLWYRR
jgi:hypothetical protein